MLKTGMKTYLQLQIYKNKYVHVSSAIGYILLFAYYKKTLCKSHYQIPKYHN